MRIAIITENFLPKIDGVTRTLTRLLEHLTDHTVILFGPYSGQIGSTPIVGAPGLPFPLYPGLRLNFWTPSLTQRLIDFKPDVIHLVDPVFFCPLALLSIKRHLSQIPIVSSYHTQLAAYCDYYCLGWLKPLMWRWNRFCHSFSRCVACPSRSSQVRLRHHGFEQVRIWPRGVELEPAKVRKGPIRLLYVGRISYEKNLGLLQACAGYRLVMVGDGPARKALEGAWEGVEWKGFLTGRDLMEAYREADLFVFPSVTETFGQVVLEAMAAGLPIVAVDSDGVRDLVRPGTGVLMEPGSCLEEDIVKFRELIELALEKREEMGRAARLEAAKYTWSNAMECMVQIYWDALSF